MAYVYVCKHRGRRQKKKSFFTINKIQNLSGVWSSAEFSKKQKIIKRNKKNH